MRRGKVTAAALPAAGATKAELATPDGRPDAPREPRPGAGADRATPCSRSRTSRPTATRARRRCAASRSTVRAGEIVGIAAVAGNGQSELAEVVTGLRACRGRVLVGGEDVANRSVRATIAARRGARARGPPRRRQRAEPLAHRQPDHEALPRPADRARAGASTQGAARKVATELKDEYAISAPSVDTQARLLSGGNLQRVILAREIESGPRLLVAVQPTRGLDVGAVETVHKLLLERRAAGAAILLISRGARRAARARGPDRRAVRGPDRRAIMDAADADIAQLGLLMTGGDAGATMCRSPRRSGAAG